MAMSKNSNLERKTGEEDLFSHLTGDFLFWLGRYVGMWRVGSQNVKVWRRADGWLEAYRLPDYKIHSLGTVIAYGQKISEPIFFNRYLSTIRDGSLRRLLPPGSFRFYEKSIDSAHSREHLLYSTLSQIMENLAEHDLFELVSSQWEEFLREDKRKEIYRFDRPVIRTLRAVYDDERANSQQTTPRQGILCLDLPALTP